MSLQPRRRYLFLGPEARDLATMMSVGTGLFNQAVLVFSGIPLARALGPENRGYIALFGLIPLAIVAFGVMGLPTAAGYYIARTPVGARSIVHSLRAILVGQCLLMFILTAALITALFWNKAPGVRIAASISLASVPTSVLFIYGIYILQGQQRFLPMNVARTLNGIMTAAAAMTIWRLDLTLPVATTLLTSAAVLAGVLTFGMAWAGIRDLPQGQSSPSVKKMLVFGAKGQLGFLTPSETFRLDQLLVGLALSTQALGIYVVASAVINLPRFVAESLGWVASPKLAGQRCREDQATVSSQYIWLSLTLTGVIVVVVELCVGRLLPALFGERFAEAVPVAHVLLVGAWFLSGRRILADCLKGAGSPGAASLSEAVALTVLIVSLVPLAHYRGLPGAAVGLTLSASASFGLLLWYGRGRLFWVRQRRDIAVGPGHEGMTEHLDPARDCAPYPRPVQAESSAPVAPSVAAAESSMMDHSFEGGRDV